MANAKPAENKEQPKPKVEKKYTLLKSVKYGDTPYKIGEKITIKDEDIEEFKRAKAIEVK